MKTLFSVLMLFFATVAVAQSTKVTVVMTSLEPDDEINYEPFVRPFIEDHLKKVLKAEPVRAEGKITNAAKDKKDAVNGAFADGALVKNALANGAKYLVVVYYDGSILQKKTLEPKEIITYGAGIGVTIQVVNTATGQILGSKKLNFSSGATMADAAVFKTKDEAAKAAIARSTGVNMDAFLKGIL